MTKIEAMERLNHCKGVLVVWREYGRSMQLQLRDAVVRAERAEAVVSAIPWQSLLDIYESGQVSDRDDDALGVFLGAYMPTGFYSKSESEE